MYLQQIYVLTCCRALNFCKTGLFWETW